MNKNPSYYNYIFFLPKSSIFKISSIELEKYKKEFIDIIISSDNITTFSYSTLGLKSFTSFMLWIQSSSLEDTQNLLNRLLHSKLGNYLKITYTLFGIKRKSVYANKDEENIKDQLRSPYLIIYPFTKTTEWYQLSFTERRELMMGHIKVGYKYSHIRQHLIYSYGIDDHEFIVSYETDSLEDFQNLVIDLRSDAVRKYTSNDLPIFTCVHKPLNELFNLL